ncbi:MAG: protein kinase, partial [archaeon]|nr:protein kinase [archaeon]
MLLYFVKQNKNIKTILILLLCLFSFFLSFFFFFFFFLFIQGTARKAFSLGTARIDAAEIKLLGTKPLGAGMFGQVWKGECRGSEVAVKIPNRASLTPLQMQAFQTEMEIMKKIQHPHCCLFMGAHVDDIKRSLQIVTELCAGDMNKLILEDKRQFPLSQRLTWALQSARGLAWLHSLLPSPILHRDLKLANLLYDAEMNVKVADFGLAQVTEGGREVWDKNPRGSLLYMAPEVYLLTHPITPKTDVHSFAMVLWEFCTRKEVYEEYFEPAKFVNDAFVGGKRPPIDANWPSRLQELFRKMWAPSPDERPDMKTVVGELAAIITEVKRQERVAFIRAKIP